MEFAAPFRVIAAHDCQCGTLLSWFDTHFLTGCDSPVSFTTGPIVRPAPAGCGMLCARVVLRCAVDASVGGWDVCGAGKRRC